MGLSFQNSCPNGILSVCFIYYNTDCSDQGNFSKVGWYNINYGGSTEVMSGDLQGGNRYYTIMPRTRTARCGPDRPWRW